MIPQRFETARLTLHHWHSTLTGPARARLEQTLQTILNPTVLKHLPAPLQLNGVSTSDWIDARAAECDVLLVTKTGTQTPIGLLICAPDPQHSTVHIGYILDQTTWGNGYATEILAGLIATLPPGTRLIGGVSTGNTASARVLAKLAFLRDANLSVTDTDIFTRTLA